MPPIGKQYLLKWKKLQLLDKNLEFICCCHSLKYDNVTDDCDNRHR